MFKRINLAVNTIVLTGICLASALTASTRAQSIYSMTQLKETAEDKCTLKKKKTVTYKDENGIEQEEVKFYDELNFDCTEEKYGGYLVQENLKFDRAKDTIWFGAVVTFKGDNYTAYCRNAGDAVEMFNASVSPGSLITVRGKFDGLEQGLIYKDINLKNCQYYSPQ